MPVDGVALSDLADVIGHRSGLRNGDVRITDLHHDSRDVGPGEGFAAIRGAVTDGHRHISSAVANGAAALVVEEEIAAELPQLVVPDTRAALPRLAAAVHGEPSRAMQLAGVTGTNGKTTVTHILESIVLAAGWTPGLVGTVGARLGSEQLAVARTTPESTDLQRLLARMRDGGVDVVGLEVSSHALDLGRVDAVWFTVASFTNLSQDHLDFHGDMERYYAAKASLFTTERAGHAVIWVDDPAGRRLAGETLLTTTTVGHADADVVGEVVGATPRYSDVVLTADGLRVEYRVPLPGGFNVANSLVAAVTAAELGIGWEAIQTGMAQTPQIPGRLEAIDAGQPFSVFVDYAHTPEAVATVIATMAKLTDGRVIAVAGAAGDRDPTKRAPMGAAAATADITVLTSDNPRSEDPQTILNEVAAGVPSAHPFEAIVDRTDAIAHAIELAEADDVVLVLGKGHERGQEFADHTIDFDDCDVARRLIARRMERTR